MAPRMFLRAPSPVGGDFTWISTPAERGSIEGIIRLEHNPRSASFRGVPMETGKTARQAQKIYETKTRSISLPESTLWLHLKVRFLFAPEPDYTAFFLANVKLSDSP